MMRACDIDGRLALCSGSIWENAKPDPAVRGGIHG